MKTLVPRVVAVVCTVTGLVLVAVGSYAAGSTPVSVSAAMHQNGEVTYLVGAAIFWMLVGIAGLLWALVLRGDSN